MGKDLPSLDKEAEIPLTEIKWKLRWGVKDTVLGRGVRSAAETWNHHHRVL